MLITRPPRPALRPFVKVVWASEDAGGEAGAERERVLPTGAAHVVFRLSELPLRVFDGPGDAVGRTVAHAVVGGPRAGFYVRDVSQPVCSVGAELHPGAVEPLLGVPAEELAGAHTPLEALWGRAAELARERLLEAGSAARRLELFESLLAERLPRVRALHPAVAHALERFSGSAPVRDVVGSSGYSHRRFIALFRRAVGLPPKLYCRILRFQVALDRAAGDPAAPWADVALASGYSDQPHLSREFHELAGVSPGDYRRIAPASARHVPIRPARSAEVNSVQDGGSRGWHDRRRKETEP